MTTIATASGAKLFIAENAAQDGPESGTPANLAEFQAITRWREIGVIEDLGEVGDQANEVTFTSLSDGRVRRLKGTRDAGVQSLIVGTDDGDVGQDYMLAAQETTFNYPFYIEGNDARTQGGANSRRYYYGLVMSEREGFGTADNVVRTTFQIGINSAIFKVKSS